MPVSDISRFTELDADSSNARQVDAEITRCRVEVDAGRLQEGLRDSMEKGI